MESKPLRIVLLFGLVGSLDASAAQQGRRGRGANEAKADKSANPNERALAAANQLSLRTPDGALITKEMVDKLTTPPGFDDALQAAVRQQHFMNGRCVSLLRDLANTGSVDDPRVIPPLVEILEYPSGVVRSTAGHVLGSLTQRRFETGGDDDDSPRQHLMSAWWRTWWQKNQDRHPVFDALLEERIHRRFVAMMTGAWDGIPLTPEQGHVRYDATNRQLLRGADANAAFSYQIDGAWLSEIRASAATVFFAVEARFLTEVPVDLQSYPHRPRPTSDAGDRITELFREQQSGTDLVIVVSAGSKDGELVRLMKENLRRLPADPANAP